jgi:hypothetical protein
MSNILVVLIISGCIAYLYLKGTVVKSFAMAINAIIANIIAFAYFEVLANFLISRNQMVLWAQSLCFAVLFVCAFAVLQTIAARLTRRPADVGFLAERIGRVVCGILLGFTVSGSVLVVLAMAPLPNKYPYQRFDQTNPNWEKPHKNLFNADGFATAWFSIVSDGSFSGEKSFAALYPNFLDQIFLNKLKAAEGVSVISSDKIIEAPTKDAVWLAPEGLKDSEEKPIPPKSGCNLTIARVGITNELTKYGGLFALSQMRFICKQKNDAKNPLAGKGKSIYPVGYLKTSSKLLMKQLSDKIKIEPPDFDERIKWIDFALFVPNDFIPVLAEFRQNGIAQLPPPIPAAQAPETVPFFQQSECAITNAELELVSSAKIYGIELATGNKFLSGLTLKIDDPNQWLSIQTDRSTNPAQFAESKTINYVRAELITEKPAAKEDKDKKESKPARPASTVEVFRPQAKSAAPAAKGIAGMLELPKPYKLLSLKCNNPATGAAIKGSQLPVLVELSGVIHHPVGVIASGKVGDQYLCEFDYCSVIAKDDPNSLVIAEDGSVTKSFPDAIWLTEQVEEIYEFYTLYLVRSDKKIFITSVRPADSQTASRFKGYECFVLR